MSYVLVFLGGIVIGAFLGKSNRDKVRAWARSLRDWYRRKGKPAA